MKLPIFQIDAFSDKVFGGNPACVVPLENWLQDEVLLKIAKEKSINLSCLQSNAEHELVDAIQAAKDNDVSCILFNPGAFTHTSVALRDAILGVEIPMIEIHISNIYGREAFREKSYFSDIALGIISGFGYKGYEAALNLAIEKT